VYGGEGKRVGVCVGVGVCQAGSVGPRAWEEPVHCDERRMHILGWVWGEVWWGEVSWGCQVAFINIVGGCVGVRVRERVSECQAGGVGPRVEEGGPVRVGGHLAQVLYWVGYVVSWGMCACVCV
jgi:hypothetical protein